MSRHLWKESRRCVGEARPWIVLRHEMKELSVVTRDDGPLAAAQPAGIAHNGIEDGLGVSRRLADDPQDLARGRLLFKSLAEGALQVGV
jgi:hypothetical protein